MDYNEILTSNSWYKSNEDHINYIHLPGKRIQQSLHHWSHQHPTPRWAYTKDGNISWTQFYNVLHNLPSEKIVDLYRCYGTGDYYQLWALYNIKNYYWRWSNHE